MNMKKQFIYGAGEYGKIMACYLVECRHEKVEAIIVSEGHKELECYETPESLSGTCIPIIELEKNEGILKDAICYMTLVAHKDEIVKKAIKVGGAKDGDVIDVLGDISEYRNSVLCAYLESRNISIEGDYLEIKDIKMVNFMKDASLRGIFEGTVGDEILPQVYGDFSFTVDGPYIESEWGIDLVEGDYVVDVGANLGLFSCYAANNGCHVYACDPDATCIEVLKKQKEIYPDNIEIVPLGLSDREGTQTFYESSACSISSMYIPRGTITEKTIMIDTIDNLVKRGVIKKVDYIKADIEGAERYMLQGAVETLKNQKPKLSICTYHFKDDPIVLEKIIKDANPDYVITHHWRKLYAYVPEGKKGSK